MKKTLFLIALIAIPFINLSAQNANKIIGYWLTQEGDSQVKIFKSEKGKYNGNIKWLKTPNEEDGTPKYLL